MRLAPILLLAAITASCSTAQWNEMRSNPREYFNLLPPTIETDAGVEGRSITLHRWQALVVRLEEDRSATRHDNPFEFLKKVGGIRKVVEAVLRKHHTNGSVWQIHVFRV